MLRSEIKRTLKQLVWPNGTIVLIAAVAIASGWLNQLIGSSADYAAVAVIAERLGFKSVSPVFDGADESQMAFWTYPDSVSVMKSAEHVHDYDEYFVVVQGKYTLVMGRKRLTLNPGDECLIPRGTRHKGEAVGGTRTIHCFGGRRAEREAKRQPKPPARRKSG